MANLPQKELPPVLVGGMREEPARLSRVRIWFLNAALTAFGIFPFFVYHECTGKFVGLGGIWGFIIATPVFALVVGVGTAVFFTTLRVLERKKKSLAAQRWFMVGPPLFFSAFMIVLTLRIATPRTRLSNICGFVPSSARHIEVTGFRAYLAGRWLTMFQVDPVDFEQIRVRLKLKSTEPFDLKEVLHKAGMLEGTRLFAKLPALKDAQCFRLEEGSSGSAFAIYALYDRATFTAIVFRMFQS